MRTLLATLIVTAATCTNGVKTMNDNLPTCTSLSDCLSHDGERVSVIAVYTVWDPLPHRAVNQAPARQVMLRFDAKDGPFLEAWGYPNHMRPLDEIARFRDKKVRVTGTFLRKMPPHPTDPPEAASLDGPCLHPVDRIELAE